MSNDVVLGSALRTNLLSLQRTQDGIDKIQNILATGLKVSSALDNPQNFFAAKGLSDRAGDLTRQLDGIGQSISTIQSADKGASAIGELIDQAESIAASAAEEATNGTSIAKVTGDTDLRNIGDITDLTGVSQGDTLVIGYLEKDGTTFQERTVTLSADDSIDQVLAKINDIGGTSSSTVYGEGEIISASLDSEGQLQLESKTGGSFRVEFEAGTTNVTDAEDQGLAAALGFGTTGRFVGSGATGTAANFEVTALASNKLVSAAFYEAGSGNGFAEAGDALSTVVNAENATAGAGTSRFVFGGEDDSDLVISLNGEAEVTLSHSALSEATIQSFVDAVNVSDRIQASYDETTGELSVESLDASVSSVQFELQSPTSVTTADRVDFGFGFARDSALTQDALVTVTGAATNFDGVSYQLGAANEILADLQNDYNTVRTQIDELVSDSGYRGVNLLKGDALTTFFDEDRDSSLNTVGRELTADGLGLSEANFSSLSSITASTNEVLAAKNDVRSFGNAIANSLSIVQTREDFTEDLVAELEAGADKLTVADQNEEGAKLLALQTRQQLGVTSLSLAVQSQQSVLRLF